MSITSPTEEESNESEKLLEEIKKIEKEIKGLEEKLKNPNTPNQQELHRKIAKRIREKIEIENKIKTWPQEIKGE